MKRTIEIRGLIYGVCITAALILFFFIMKALGLIYNPNLRALNAFIMFGGVFLAIRAYKRSHRTKYNFLNALMVGVGTSIVTAILFSTFVTFYVATHPEFMAAIKKAEPLGEYINNWSVASAIFIEATISGSLFSYISMQWLKGHSVPSYHEVNKPQISEG